MNRLVVFVLILFLSFSCVSAQSEEDNSNYLYSEEYFDYLIECANEDALSKQNEQQKEEVAEDSEMVYKPDDEICPDCKPFRLRIEENSSVGAYSETFKKEDTKTIIPVGDKFSFVQDTLKYKNRYNSDDYRVLAGVEINPFKFLNFASGLETNYRGIDQNPTSRKLYFIRKNQYG